MESNIFSARLLPVPMQPPRSLQSVWFQHFGDLGLAPEYIKRPVVVSAKHFTPDFWLANWNTFVYVLPDRTRWTAEHERIYNEAQVLSLNIKNFDVIVVVGSPAASYDNIILFSYILGLWFELLPDHKAICQNQWTIAGVFDAKNNSARCWLLFSDDFDVYDPREQEWSSACPCAQPDCDECADFKVFYPIVGVDEIITDPTIGKSPQRRKAG